MCSTAPKLGLYDFFHTDQTPLVTQQTAWHSYSHCYVQQPKRSHFNRLLITAHTVTENCLNCLKAAHLLMFRKIEMSGYWFGCVLVISFNVS